MIFRARNKCFDLSKKKLLMAIINLTPDSFSDGGELPDQKIAVQTIRQAIKKGADIIDLGAESTRPGAEEIDAERQWNRIEPVLKELVQDPECIISIDTSDPFVAKKSLELGAHIINDVRGFKKAPSLASIVKEYEAGCILMHMRGTPLTMKEETDYQDLIQNILEELNESLEIAKAAGISKENIMIDPGIGFAKTREQSFQIIRSLSEFKKQGYPVLVGPSRKSFLTKVLGDEREPKERVWGTAGAVSVCLQNGADAIRVHDVPQMSDVLKVTQACL